MLCKISIIGCDFAEMRIDLITGRVIIPSWQQFAEFE